MAAPLQPSASLPPPPAPAARGGAGTGAGTGAVVPLTIRMEEGPPSTDGSHAALYRIILQLGPNHGWSVLRRYTEFNDLRKEIAPMLSERENDLFPSKHPLSSSTNPDVVAERLRQLPLWLMAVSSHPVVSLNKSFRQFLRLNEFEAELRAAQQGVLGAEAPPPSASLAATKAAASMAGPGAQGAAGIGSSLRGQPSQPASAPLQSQIRQPQRQQHQQRDRGQPSQSLGSSSASSAAATATALPLVETATLQAQPSISEPGGFKATGVAEAPPAPHDESATATTQVEVRLPPVAVPQVTGRVEAARQEVLQAKREEDESRRLNERALHLEKATEDLGKKASDKMREATLLRDKEVALKAQASNAASEAQTLENAAKAKRSEALHYWTLSQEREEEARRREQEGERLMREYNDALRKAQAAKQEADLLHRDAEAKRLEATESLERAAAEVVERERQSEIEGQQETVRQAAFAAAAAARAKREIAEAAKAKAEEEALVAQAHVLAKAEAEAQAEIQLAQHRLTMAKAKKEALEQKAAHAEKVAHIDTERAAHDAAEVDARVKAAALVAERTREAHYLAQRAENDWQKAENVRESFLERAEREKVGVTSLTAAVAAASLISASDLVAAGGAGGGAGQEDLDALSTRSIASSSVGEMASQSPAVPSLPLREFVQQGRNVVTSGWRSGTALSGAKDPQRQQREQQEEKREQGRKEQEDHQHKHQHQGKGGDSGNGILSSSGGDARGGEERMKERRQTAVAEEEEEGGEGDEQPWWESMVVAGEMLFILALVLLFFVLLFSWLVEREGLVGELQLRALRASAGGSKGFLPFLRELFYRALLGSVGVGHQLFDFALVDTPHSLGGMVLTVLKGSPATSPLPA